MCDNARMGRAGGGKRSRAMLETGRYGGARAVASNADSVDVPVSSNQSQRNVQFHEMQASLWPHAMQVRMVTAGRSGAPRWRRPRGTRRGEARPGGAPAAAERWAQGAGTRQRSDGRVTRQWQSPSNGHKLRALWQASMNRNSDVKYGFVKSAFGEGDSNPCIVADAGGSYGRVVCRLIDFPCASGNT